MQYIFHKEVTLLTFMKQEKVISVVFVLKQTERL